MPDKNETERADQPPEQIVRSATEARQGEIVLGRRGRIIWIGSFLPMTLLVLLLAPWW